MFFRIKPSGERRYLQIVENTRDGARTVQRVVATLGRVEELQTDGRLRPPDLWAMSRTLRRHQFVDQPKISAWKQRFGGVEVIAEMPKRMVGGSVGERVEADGEGFGWQIRQEIDLGVVDSAQQAAGIVTARHLLTDNLHHGSLGPVCDHFDGIHQMLALRA